MFSKVFSRANQFQQIAGVSARSFRATAAANNTKKPSIGDAVTILQSKVSGINQVVSSTTNFKKLMAVVGSKKDRAAYVFLSASSACMSES